MTRSPVSATRHDQLSPTRALSGGSWGIRHKQEEGPGLHLPAAMRSTTIPGWRTRRDTRRTQGRHVLGTARAFFAAHHIEVLAMFADDGSLLSLILFHREARSERQTRPYPQTDQREGQALQSHLGCRVEPPRFTTSSASPPRESSRSGTWPAGTTRATDVECDFNTRQMRSNKVPSQRARS